MFAALLAIVFNDCLIVHKLHAATWTSSLKESGPHAPGRGYFKKNLKG